MRKQNTNIVVHTNWGMAKSTDKLWSKMICVIEHIYGNHRWCGTWSPFLRCKGDKKKKSKLYYLDKQKDPKTYNQLKDITKKYITEKILDKIMYSWNTNTNASLNNAIEKYCPKDTYFCISISGWLRIFIAVAIHSVGHIEFYQRLCEAIGMRYNNMTIKQQHEIMDKIHIYHKKYEKRPEVIKKTLNSYITENERKSDKTTRRCIQGQNI